MILIIINPVDYRRRGEAFGRWLRLCQNMAEYSGRGCFYAKLRYEDVFCRVQFSWDVRERQARGWRIRPGGLIYATRFCLVWQALWSIDWWGGSRLPTQFIAGEERKRFGSDWDHAKIWTETKHRKVNRYLWRWMRIKNIGGYGSNLFIHRQR